MFVAYVYDVLGIQKEVDLEAPTPVSVSARLRRQSKTPVAGRRIGFEFNSSGPDARDDDTTATLCTPQQAATFGELIATTLDTRTVEPFVTSW